MGGCGSTSAIKIPHEKRYRRAIKLYQVNEVKSLTNLLNRNKCFESGESPLTLAAQEGHEAVVQSLVVSGADVNKLDNNGKGALHIATQLNDEETVEILLSASANPNKYDSVNATPLHLASENGNTPIVRRLLKAGARVNESSRGLSPLVYAVVHGYAECVDELLRHGADPNVVDARGNTLLHVSVRNKDPRSTQVLLEYKASPRLPSHDNTSLVCLACLTGCHETLRLLLELAGCDVTDFREEEPPPVIAATIVGNADCIDVLLNAGADPNTVDKRGQSALQITVTSVTDPSKESFYGKYFANLYRQYSKYDVDEVSHENSTRCTMSLVTGGVNTISVWDRFSTYFPRPEGVSFEQMVLAEVLIQCFGFQSLAANTVRTFVSKLIQAGEHGLLKLLYSAGVDPTWSEESMVGMSTNQHDRQLFRWIKKLRTTPRSLKDMCRQTIRRSLSWNVLYLVHKVPILSEDMREYVCIMDTEHYSIFDDPEGNNNQPVADTSCSVNDKDSKSCEKLDKSVINEQVKPTRHVLTVQDAPSELPDLRLGHVHKVIHNGIAANGIHHNLGNGVQDTSLLDQPVQDSSVMDQPVQDSSVMDQPVQDSSVMDQPVQDSSVMDQPVQDSSVMDQQMQDSSLLDQSVQQDSPFLDRSIQDSSFLDRSVQDSSFLDEQAEDTSLDDEDPLDLLEEHHRITQTDINGMLFGHDTAINLEPDKLETGNGAICTILSDKTSVADIIIDDSLRETVT